ncbi:MAG: glycosyltransferase [Candidatus Moranbacteria bacterium]|nr:glycosyltransferase [Candidatus Moranbacteria bacterium]
MKKPIVSVVMPTYNRIEYLEEAIKSILNQSLKRLELIIVDDGSTDSSIKLIKKYAAKDPRVVYIYNKKDKGVVGASNLGIRRSKGKYIARMDSDDISLPKRLEKEVNFLENHPEIDACGGWVETMGKKGGKVWHITTDPDEIKCTMLFCGAVANPTSLVRRSVFFDLGIWYTAYRGIQIAEDYDFWVRLAEKAKIANIPSVVLLYRWHDTNATTSNNSAQSKRVKHIMLRQLNKLGINPTRYEIGIHQKMGSGEYIGGGKYGIRRIGEWTDKLIMANKKTGAFPEPAFSRVANKKREEALEIHYNYRERLTLVRLIVFFVALGGKILRLFLSGKKVDVIYKKLQLLYEWIQEMVGSNKHSKITSKKLINNRHDNR